MAIKEIIENTLNSIFSHIGVSPIVEINEQDEKIYQVTIDGNNLNFLIGFRGQSLDALQSLTQLIVFRKLNEPVSIIIDINGYRDQKIERLHNMAKSFIDKARFFQQEVQFPPMNPWERRQIHSFVNDYDDVISESTGEGRDRRVVLKLKP